MVMTSLSSVETARQRVTCRINQLPIAEISWSIPVGTDHGAGLGHISTLSFGIVFLCEDSKENLVQLLHSWLQIQSPPHGLLKTENV